MGRVGKKAKANGPWRWKGKISAPPRQGPLNAALILLIVVLPAAASPLPPGLTPWLLVPLVSALVLGWPRRSPYVVHTGSLVGVLFLIHLFPKLYQYWPLPLFLILGLYGLVVWGIPWLRSASSWRKWGVPDRSTWILTVLFALAAAGGVTAWRFLAHPDLNRFRAFVPADVPLWLLPLGIVIYAFLNAAYEEIVWRGVLMESLEAAFGRGMTSLFLQAAGFGLWHFRGFPNGWLGVGLAAVFALMMGILRRKSSGMLAPWVAHVFADVTIYILVAVMVFSA
jgi:membrane protease YdiL (CAAX protease family)